MTAELLVLAFVASVSFSAALLGLAILVAVLRGRR